MVPPIFCSSIFIATDELFLMFSHHPDFPAVERCRAKNGEPIFHPTCFDSSCVMEAARRAEKGTGAIVFGTRLAAPPTSGARRARGAKEGSLEMADLWAIERLRRVLVAERAALNAEEH